MMNDHNPQGKDIRFIDSHYTDLFRVPDGGYIQVDYPDETVIKPCKFLDEYHTQIGTNVFHICEFAERMERMGANYQAEPPIMGDEAAWKISRDSFLMLQSCDDGYDYTLYDRDFQLLDGGQLDDPDMTMLEARNAILAEHGFQYRELRAVPCDILMEQVEKRESRESVMDKLKEASGIVAPAKGSHKRTEPEL